MTPAQKLAAFVETDLARKAEAQQAVDAGSALILDHFDAGLINGPATITFERVEPELDPWADDFVPAVPNSRGRLPSPVVRDPNIDLP